MDDGELGTNISRYNLKTLTQQFLPTIYKVRWDSLAKFGTLDAITENELWSIHLNYNLMYPNPLV